MAKVSAMAIPGLDLWFNTSDHLPPHFHARKPGTWEVRVYPVECSVGRLVFSMKWPRRGAGPSRRERRVILQATLEHRVKLLEEWETKVAKKEKS